ncbi:MAG TPA: hypothetical protein DCY64_22755 [Hydrogenophaga sp.]|uniref:hypothetical protein n=1 Tax=Hydrogenophaga sp. TaxID=1904254 RepID=UPI0008B47350|nr:hypothetical protein [Hydrogenophaga sp.]OGA78807.1 MAG: hypothetical protein A2X73_07595 [Burkholderiales bacterium GWE1_65_30]OGA89378.1 MAG: hypothetical protein A2X72_16755 [Burkholderiales bacterium GWF1_66_17]HAX23093.1 hypothetical protein [Hydrogenophaga sp.]HBU17042.1 hypothetical protein [Hydrogenophaga sp.]
MLTDKKIDAITYEQWGVSARYLYPAYRVYARAIEAAAEAPLLARIAELERQLAQPAGEPVAHSVVSGALFDFLGFLTSQKDQIVFSASDDAAPAVDAIRAFSAKRGLCLDNAKVREWIDCLDHPAHGKDAP